MIDFFREAVKFDLYLWRIIVIAQLTLGDGKGLPGWWCFLHNHLAFKNQKSIITFFSENFKKWVSTAGIPPASQVWEVFGRYLTFKFFFLLLAIFLTPYKKLPFFQFLGILNFFNHFLASCPVDFTNWCLNFSYKNWILNFVVYLYGQFLVN